MNRKRLVVLRKYYKKIQGKFSMQLICTPDIKIRGYLKNN